MNKNHLFGVIMVVLVIFGGWYLFHTLGPRKPILVGIARWVTNEEYDRNIAAFKEALTLAGFIEGREIQYLIRNPELDGEKQREIIQEFLDKKVDLIYSLTTPGTLIAKEMTKDIPIVFSIVTYPVEAKVIQSLENSGNNLVGTRNYISINRQLDTFLQIQSGVKNIGCVHRVGEPNSAIQCKELTQAALKKGIRVIDIASASKDALPDDLEAAGNPDALFSTCDTLIQGGGEEIVIAYAKKNRLPDFSCNKSGLKKGSLIGNIADFAVIGKIAGQKAARLLTGATPQSLKTESPEKDYIMINLARARELGIEVSTEFILSVSEAIE